MKRATFNILFFVKWKRPLRNGEVPIYMRLTISGSMAEIASRYRIFTSNSSAFQSWKKASRGVLRC
jgi:hypothetical protein